MMLCLVKKNFRFLASDLIWLRNTYVHQMEQNKEQVREKLLCGNSRYHFYCTKTYQPIHDNTNQDCLHFESKKYHRMSLFGNFYSENRISLANCLALILLHAAIHFQRVNSSCTFVSLHDSMQKKERRNLCQWLHIRFTNNNGMCSTEKMRKPNQSDTSE